jgi:hypothetical protein
MIGLIAIIAASCVAGELTIYHLMLNSAAADRDLSYVAQFFGSVWPGILLFLTMVAAAATGACWWLGVEINV